MSEAVDDIVHEFIVESRENLDRFEADLVFLEKNRDDGKRLAGIFRAIHTIKGTCGFLGFRRLQALAHAGEDLLASLRDGTILLDRDRAGLLLELVDEIRRILVEIESTGAEPTGDSHQLIRKLAKSSSADDTVASVEAVSTPAAAPSPKDDATGEAPPPSASAKGAGDGRIRVRVELLDRLMTLVGELVLARNQLMEQVAQFDDPQVALPFQRLNLITTALQESVVKTRMQPIGSVLGKLPRIVRDVATSCGKRVRVEIEGEGTELDRTLIEAIKDPLTHLVRNAVDHGIETPDERLRRGKSPIGTLSLRAFHEAGHMRIVIADDGAGISREQVKRKAIERGLIAADRADSMSDSEIVELVFRPGFSTAEKVTNVSGRGVGMDVAKTNVERIGGYLELESREGRGTTVQIRMPLTLAIIQALIVVDGTERYAIPNVNLVELVHLEADAKLESFQGARVLRIRGKLLPVLTLAEVFGRDDEGNHELSGEVVIVDAFGTAFGILVGEVADTAEIVVKPMPKRLSALRAFSGVTVTSDGSVALILDVANIARMSGLSIERHELADTEAAPAPTETKAVASQKLLIVSVGDARRFAIPLGMATRIEDIAASRVHLCGGVEVVQYRGRIMPVVRIASSTVRRAESPTGRLQIVIHDDPTTKRSVGFVVSRAVDVVEVPEEADRLRDDAGGVRSVVVGDGVAEFLDLDHMARTAVQLLTTIPILEGVDV